MMSLGPAVDASLHAPGALPSLLGAAVPVMGALAYFIQKNTGPARDFLVARTELARAQAANQVVVADAIKDIQAEVREIAAANDKALRGYQRFESRVEAFETGLAAIHAYVLGKRP